MQTSSYVMPYRQPCSRDTLLGLKARSFLLIASHSLGRLARVEATTLARQKRVTIHRRWRRAHLPHLAKKLATEDVCRADYIAVRRNPQLGQRYTRPAG